MAITDDLRDRLQKMETRFERYLEMGSIRARELEQRIAAIEKVGAGQDEKILNHFREVQSLERHLNRMENSLLKEFKISQDIMKSMLDHEFAIDKAKLDLKLEMERREAEILNEQKNLEMKLKQERRQFRREIIIKAGAIGLPILTALVTAISYMIEIYFAK